ncbi:hypothetical protein ACFPA8_01275 [Streptomyces ovatisporus]|uniref:Secreted protein n=1 Tax=Streptomyces ovatisporus TaxID=1128682 RepID=A0ABV9A140_9ACTN
MQQVTRKLLSVAVISAAAVVAGMGVASADTSGSPSTSPAQGSQPQAQAAQPQPQVQGSQPQGQAAQPQGRAAQPQGRAAQPQGQDWAKLVPQNLPNPQNLQNPQSPQNQKGPLGLPVTSPLTSGLRL